MEHWVAVDDFGSLFIEQELARLDIPFMFVCLDDMQTRYLALCYDDKKYKYILSQCDNTSLIEILNGKLSIDTFLKDTNDIILLDLVDWDKAIAHKKKYKDLSRDILPKKDTFFTIKNKSIDEYMKQLKTMVMEIPNRFHNAMQQDKYEILSDKYISRLKYIKNIRKIDEHKLVCLNGENQNFYNLSVLNKNSIMSYK